MGDRSTGVLAAMAAAYFLFLLLPSLSPHYGFYSDELYYLACADRLAFGYVDHPPFFVLLLRLHRELFGDSLFALRALPAATGALTVFLTGWMARRMGGALFAQVLAALASMMSLQSQVIFSFFSVNCVEVLLWAAASWVFVELCRSREPRLWVVLGLVLGLSLLTKHTTVILIVGLAVATMLSSLRRDLLGRWPWIGVLVALVVISPNIYWQAANDWVSLEFYRSATETNIPMRPLDVLVNQIVVQNPASFPIWAAAIFFFLRSPRGRRFRPLGWAFVTVMVIAMIGGQSRADRIGGIYAVAFAGGAVLLEAIRKPDSDRLRRAWNTYALPSVLLLFGLAGATLVLPILPPDVLAGHPLYDADEGSGFRPEVGKNLIPYHLGNRTHWKSFVAKVEEVYGGLDPKQRERTIILADYFGHAGALEYYGADRLPPVYSQHTGYFLWGPPDGSPETVISIGINESFLRANFEHVTTAAIFRCGPYCPPWVNELPIRIATSPRRSFQALWPELGEIGGMDRRRRLLREQESE
jgi:hypothetical protein